jgi:hypothetical protein
MEEKRQCLRVKTALPVKYSKLDPGSLDVSAVSRDISVNGIRLVVDQKMSLGAKLRLRFHLPGQAGDVTLAGKLIWQAVDPVYAGKVDCGIQYCDADPDEIAKINNFISGQLKFLLASRDHGSGGGLKPVKDALGRTRRIPWDKSPVVSPPDFLTQEINLPGDGLRYCRIKREVSVHYALEGKIIQEIASLNQYISSKSAWLLLDRMLTHSMAMKLTIAMPENDPVKAFGWVEKIVSRTYQDARQSFILHATKVRFRDISKVDRARLVRCVYAAGNECILLRDDPPPEWA